MKRLLTLLFIICTGIAVLSAQPQVNEALLEKAKQSRSAQPKVLKPTNSVSKKLMAPALANHVNAISPKELRERNFSLLHSLLTDRQVREGWLTEELLLGERLVFTDLNDWSINSSGYIEYEPQDPYDVGGWISTVERGDVEGELVARNFYNGYDLPFRVYCNDDEINFHVGIRYKFMGTRTSSSVTSGIKTDTVQKMYVFPDYYMVNHDLDDESFGFAGDDGSFWFESGFLYYFENYITVSSVSTGAVISRDTVVTTSPVFSIAYFLPANGEHEFQEVIATPKDNYPWVEGDEFWVTDTVTKVAKVYLQQAFDTTVFIWNIYGSGMFCNDMDIREDGRMYWRAQGFWDYVDTTEYYYYGVGCWVNYSAEWTGAGYNYSTMVEGCEGTVNPDLISWDITVPYDYYTIKPPLLNNKLYYTNGNKFIGGGYDFVDGGIYYKVNGDQATVNYVTEDAVLGGNLIIPATVTHHKIYEGQKTYSVTGIGRMALAGFQRLTCMTIPVTLTRVGEGAFDNLSLQGLYITGSGPWQGGALSATMDTLYVGGAVTSIEGMKLSPSVIYAFGSTPPVCDDNTFVITDAVLHMPSTSFASYFVADYWNDFLNMENDAVEPVSMSLNTSSADLIVGDLSLLKAIVEPENASPAEIVWVSTDNDVASVYGEGGVTAVGKGECDIIAVYLDKRARCHINVDVILPTSVTISQESLMLETGTTEQLTATVEPENTTYKDITWTTTDPDVATVEDGLVTAVGPGECDIIAACQEQQAVCHVIVVNRFIYISLDHHQDSVMPNHMIILTPTMTPVSTDLAVTSSNPDVAAARVANGVIQVMGITPGKTTITVGSADGYAAPDSCEVTVYLMLGDVNCDGFVSIADVTSLIDYLLGVEVTPFDVAMADVDHDHFVTVQDLTTLIDYLLGVIDHFEELEPGVYAVRGAKFKMIPVEGGTYMMGATEDQGPEALDGEKPAHQVTVSSFSIGETTVTQRLWLAVMGSNPSYYTGDLDRPVDKVNIYDCEEFISRLNEITGEHFRLPTEAEWEFAARGGNLSQGYKYAGSNDINEVAWWGYEYHEWNIPYDGGDIASTHPVAQKKPNELGLYDMSGNIWEWCSDYLGTYTSEPQVDPVGSNTSYSAIRGGGYYHWAYYCRSSSRDYGPKDYRYRNIGFRLAL